jgi:hypothetical protein
MDTTLALVLISLIGVAAFASGYLAGLQRRKRALTEVKTRAAQGAPIDKPQSAASHR